MDTSFIIRRHHGSSYQARAPRDRRLNGDEAARLIVACGGMYKDPRGWQLLMGLALETAMRAGDLIGMQWDEVNMDQRFIVIPKEREKTRKGRQVPLSTKALGGLAELKMHRVKGEPRVLATLPAVSSALGRGFKRITKGADCSDLHFYDLRHEAVVRFIVSPRLCRRWRRHGSLGIPN